MLYHVTESNLHQMQMIHQELLPTCCKALPMLLSQQSKHNDNGLKLTDRVP